ncbi:hypothetical protein TTHERM_00658940 (macronuclear) [Tetrahymena thermophila SB210]|uniref:COG complex component COG2 C-terminal domain-containing protein n=1 Tax=Tetrahymena thermophila (strain SB210) TaxID=312017 RepID=I7MI30_TETTS|nr:hypothetical protein TTHERM_00658940 [Tetrahymena thermophila SB210]EAS03850.2 hypothetical protein TTHERM_00658940 [Tetrahymena thermophila SB210]|eukprot:XP_001024095.2 hypothetical protein TTHERM_00658940 [Tetrahymena thermophila SB210]
MDIIQQIDQLQAKLNIQQYKDSHVDLNQIDDKQFNIIQFLRHNFLKDPKDNDVELDMEKINNTISYIYELQRETCEQIAISVDMNLDKYVAISKKFDDMKDYFSKTDNLYNQIASEMKISRDACTQKIENVNETLENYQYICNLEDNLKILEKIVALLKDIDAGILQIKKSSSFQGFKILNACKQLNTSKKIYKEKIEIALQTRELSQKYKLVQQINDMFVSLSTEIDKQFRSLLTGYLENKQLFQEDPNKKRQLSVFLSAFSSLSSKQTAEKSIQDIIIKPYFQKVFKQMAECKKNIVVATKQEYLQQSQNMKVGPFQILQSNLSTFIQQIYTPLLNLIQYSQEENSQQEDEEFYNYNIYGYDIIKVLLDTICEFFKADDMNFIFSFGSSDIFFQNYTSFQQILIEIKQLYQDENKIKESCFENEKKIQEKWNVKTYFYIRQQEIVKEFESKLSNIISNPIQINSFYQLLTDQVMKCFDENIIFIKRASALFLKLSLQLIARFSAKVQQFTSQETSKQYQNEIVDDLCRLESHLPDYYKTVVYSKFNQESQKDLFNQIVLEVKKILRTAASAYLDSKIYQSKTKALNNS